MSKHFWTVIERGSYLATLFIGLVEMLKLVSSCLY